MQTCSLPWPSNFEKATSGEGCSRSQGGCKRSKLNRIGTFKFIVRTAKQETKSCRRFIVNVFLFRSLMPLSSGSDSRTPRLISRFYVVLHGSADDDVEPAPADETAENDGEKKLKQNEEDDLAEEWTWICTLSGVAFESCRLSCWLDLNFHNWRVFYRERFAFNAIVALLNFPETLSRRWDKCDIEYTSERTSRWFWQVLTRK